MNDFKTYHSLPQDAMLIRKAVFIEEQGFTDEFDEIDTTALHILLYNSEHEPIATCRYFWDKALDSFVVGRIAVIKECRNRHYGAVVLKEAERQVKEAGGKKVLLAAQVQAQTFYEKQGFSIMGEEFLEEHCPHIWMYKSLEV